VAFGLNVNVDSIDLPVYSPLVIRQGGSDDIADISWSLPTVVLRYPSNMPGMPGHHWANAITMATPIAHKGCTAGAKVEAHTILDMLMKPEIIKNAWTYYHEIQTKEQKYQPLINPNDQPALHLNKEIMETFSPKMSKFYYNPKLYKTYLEQLGIRYPTLRPDQLEAVQKLKGN
jgi:aminobenzoyl-glutamate utilization protein B